MVPEIRSNLTKNPEGKYTRTSKQIIAWTTNIPNSLRGTKNINFQTIISGAHVNFAECILWGGEWESTESTSLQREMWDFWASQLKIGLIRRLSMSQLVQRFVLLQMICAVVGSARLWVGSVSQVRILDSTPFPRHGGSKVPITRVDRMQACGS